jgi:hypothetical protein
MKSKRKKKKKKKSEEREKWRKIEPASISLADVSKGTQAPSYQCSCLLKALQI